MANMPATVTVAEVVGTIEKWLAEEGFRVWRLTDEESQFSYKVNRDDSVPLLVCQPHDRADSLLVVGDVKFTSESQERFLTLPDSEKRFLLFDFRMLLLSTGCRWQFLPTAESWKTIRVSKTVFYDGLSKHQFFEAVDIVQRAVSSVLLTFQWKFDIAPYVS